MEWITDGGFEEASTAWYVEDGAGSVVAGDGHGASSVTEVPAEGAYAGQSIFCTPGTTCRLSGWLRLTAAGDEGVLGVVFRGADDARLTDAEPAPVRVTGTAFEETSLDFTPP